MNEATASAAVASGYFSSVSTSGITPSRIRVLKAGAVVTLQYYANVTSVSASNNTIMIIAENKGIRPAALTISALYDDTYNVITGAGITIATNGSIALRSASNSFSEINGKTIRCDITFLTDE